MILEADACDHWLDPAVTERDELEGLLRPAAEGTLQRWAVSKDVGNVRNDGPELVEEVVSAPQR